MLNIYLKNVYESLAFKKILLKASRFFYFTKLNFTPLELSKDDKCIFLAPHPDDETFGGGGLLAKYPENFHVVCLTNGNGGCLDDTQSKTSRQQEFKNALKIAGITSYECLDIEDRKLIKNYEIFKKIDFKPYNYIFIPYFFDNHKDHKAVNILLQKLIRESSFNKNSKIVFYEVWSTLPVFSHYVDISPFYEKKKEMINCYQSQIKYVDFLKGITSLNSYRGFCTNIAYAEAFSIIDIKTFSQKVQIK